MEEAAPEGHDEFVNDTASMASASSSEDAFPSKKRSIDMGMLKSGVVGQIATEMAAMSVEASKENSAEKMENETTQSTPNSPIQEVQQLEEEVIQEFHQREEEVVREVYRCCAPMEAEEEIRKYSFVEYEKEGTKIDFCSQVSGMTDQTAVDEVSPVLSKSSSLTSEAEAVIRSSVHDTIANVINESLSVVQAMGQVEPPLFASTTATSQDAQAADGGDSGGLNVTVVFREEESPTQHVAHEIAETVVGSSLTELATEYSSTVPADSPVPDDKDLHIPKLESWMTDLKKENEALRDEVRQIHAHFETERAELIKTTHEKATFNEHERLIKLFTDKEAEYNETITKQWSDIISLKDQREEQEKEHTLQLEEIRNTLLQEHSLQSSNISILEAQVTALQAELEEKKNTLDKRDKDIRGYQDQSEQLQKELDTVTAKMAEINLTASSDTSGFEVKIFELERKLTEKTDAANDNDKRANELQLELNNLSRKLAEGLDYFREKETALNESQAVNVKLQADITELSEKLKLLLQENEEKDAKFESGVTLFKEKELELDETLARLKVVEIQLTESQEHVLSLQETNSSLTIQISETAAPKEEAADLTAYQAKIAQLESELEAFSTKFDKGHTMYNEKEAALNESYNLLSQCREDIVAYEAKIEYYKAEIEERDTKYVEGVAAYRQKETELENALREMDKISEERNAFEAQLAAAVAAKEVEKACAEAEPEDTHAAYEQKIAQLTLAFEEEQQTILTKLAEKDELNEKKVAALTLSLEEKKEVAISALTLELSDLKAKYTQCECDVVKYKSQIQELRETKEEAISALTQELSDLKTKYTECESNVETYKSQIQELRETVQVNNVVVTQVHVEKETSQSAVTEEKVDEKLQQLQAEMSEREKKYEADVVAYQNQIQKDTVTICALEEKINVLVCKFKEERQVTMESPPAPRLIVQQPMKTSQDEIIIKLQREISELKTTISEQELVQKSLEKDLSGMQARLSDMTGELSEQQKEMLEAAQSMVKTKTEELLSAQKKMVDLSTIIDEYKEKVESHKKETHKKEIEEKKSLSSKVKNLLNEKDSKIKELQASVNKLKEDMEKLAKSHKEEGRITKELTILGAQCRGDRHEETITRQRDALGELRTRIKAVEQSRPALPGHDQALQQIVLLKREMAELRASSALAEHKSVLQSNIFRNVQEAVRSSVTDSRVGLLDVSQSSAVHAENILPAISKSVENKSRLSATLKEQATNRARTLHNTSCTSSIESMLNAETNITGPSLAWAETLENDGGITSYAPKPPETPKSGSSPRGRLSRASDRPTSAESVFNSRDSMVLSSSNLAAVGRGGPVKVGWTDKAEKMNRAETDMERSAHLESMKALECSEETYLTLLQRIAIIFDMDDLGIRSIAHLHPDERQRLVVERQQACETVCNRIKVIQERLSRKDELLNGYEKDLGKLRQAEILVEDRNKQLTNLTSELRQTIEELQYMRESLDRTREKYEQEKRLNAAIKQKKTFHMESEKAKGGDGSACIKIHENCALKDEKERKVQLKKKEQKSALQKKNYELKVLKNELHHKDRMLSDAKRSLHLVRNPVAPHIHSTTDSSDATERTFGELAKKNLATEA